MQEFVTANNAHVGLVHSKFFKLKNREIPPFTGKAEEYVSFEQNFMAMVGKQNREPLQRLAHLRMPLRGKPLDNIPHLGSENADENRACEVLDSRLKNRTKLVAQLNEGLQGLKVGADASPMSTPLLPNSMTLSLLLSRAR